MPDALLDLLLGSSCAVCARPGRALCRSCRGDLPTMPAVAMPTPCPPGLVVTVAAGEYAGPIRNLVNAHKEQGRFALADPLGDLLAGAVRSLAEGIPAAPGLLLVPVPSRGVVVRRRGHDPLLRVAQRAASRLRRAGVDVRVARLLRSTRAPRDQTGLAAAERAGNLAGSMVCRRGRGASTWRGVAPAAGPGGARAGPLPSVVVVDDVVTTGATVREAQRALEAAGVAVAGVAAVAATRRRLRLDQAGATNREEYEVDRVPDYRFAPAATSV